MIHYCRCIAVGAAIGVLLGIGGIYLALVYGPDLNQEF